MSDYIISVISVIHNAESALEHQLTLFLQAMEQSAKHYEIILVDNGSTDKTIERAKALMSNERSIRLLVLADNYSEEVGYYAGLDNAIGDYALLVNLQEDPANQIPQMLSLCTNDGYDLVLMKQTYLTRLPLIYRFLSSLFYMLIRIMTGKFVDNRYSYFTCMNRKVIDSITLEKDRIKFLKFYELQTGFKWTFLEYEVNCKSITVRGLLRSIYSGLERMVATTEKLLRGCGLLAAIVSFGNLIYIVYSLLSWVFNSHLQKGWTSTSVFLASMFCILFFIIAFICEYLSVIYKETKKGPLYHIVEDIDHSHYLKNIIDKNVIK